MICMYVYISYVICWITILTSKLGNEIDVCVFDDEAIDKLKLVGDKKVGGRLVSYIVSILSISINLGKLNNVPTVSYTILYLRPSVINFLSKLIDKIGK